MRTRKVGLMEAQSIYALPRILIKPQVIRPNDSITGVFVCDTNEMKNKVKGNFIISVRVDSEEHKFTFSRS